MRLLPALALLSCLTPIFPAAALSVRVVTTPGGPQIAVDGKPIPPRFFWGSLNGGRVALTPEWTPQSFEFMPGEVDGSGTLHFRFSQTAAELWLADLRLQDAVTGEDVLPTDSFATAAGYGKTWNTWPLAEANTVGTAELSDGALHVTLRNPPGGGKWPDFHLHSKANLRFAKDRLYRCSFRARATPGVDLRPQVYHIIGGVYTYVGGPPGAFLSQIALARDAGVNLVSFSAPSCWTAPEKPVSWLALDSLCRQIIAVNPQVLLVPLVSADAPNWWLEAHPESRMVYDGDKAVVHSCVSDREYRADVCAHLEKLSRHLTEEFPDHFAGIHPCGQNTGEWFYYDSWQRPLSGYDKDTRAAFRQWLKALGDPGADTAEPPSADERRAHPNGLLRDPAKERRLIEFARFQQQEMADHVLAMAAACRRGTLGQKLVIFFYGYLFEFPPVQGGAPTSGHYALGKVLKSKDIDILCSPISYTDRDWLGTAPCMTAAESVMKAGILWLNEDDSRTFLDPRQQERVLEGGLVNLEQTQQVMLRNTAQESLRGFGSWWMDLPAQGWFNDARIWEMMVKLQAVDAAMAQRVRAFTPEIAAIIDEDSMCHLPGGSAAFARPLIYEGRAALGRCGAPYGQYLLDDVIAGQVTAKLQVYLAAYALTPAERAALAKPHPDSTRVWCYAPGYIQADRLDAAGITDLTGFEVRPVALVPAAVTLTAAGQRAGLTEGWEAGNLGTPKEPVTPLFAVIATPDETWASYSDGSPAIAVRRTARGLEVFVGVPKLTPELLRALAKLAGVHVYTEGKATVWATDGYLSFQAHEAGPLTLDLGSAGPVYDALDGRALGQGPTLTLTVRQGETRVLRW
jgi:hypothetical protein